MNATTTPCPWCKSASVNNGIEYVSPEIYRVVCNNCGGTGPRASSPAIAVDLYEDAPANKKAAELELTIRAPAVPDWFEPEGDELNRSTITSYDKDGRPFVHYSDDYDRARIIQWPSAYARMVMEARNANS